MTAKLETYYNIAEKEKRIAELYALHGENAVFIVPGELDKELTVQLASENGSYFGGRAKAWTWSDLYREVCRGVGAVFRRVIDPPDHSLIIGHVLEGFLAAAGERGAELPPGVKRRGFASVLGENIRELLREELSPQRLSELLTLPESGTFDEPEAILSHLYASYVEYLEQHKIADSTQIPTLTRHALSRPEGLRLVAGYTFIFIGFLSFTGGQLKLVKAMTEILNCVFILPETGLDDFHDGIKQLGLEYEKRSTWSANICCLLASGEQLQFSALARELALWQNGNGELAGADGLGVLANYGEVGVQVEPRQLSRLQSALVRYSIPFNAQVRESAADTAAGRLLRETWDASESGWEVKKTAAMLTNPLFGVEGQTFFEYIKDFTEGRASWLKILDPGGRKRFWSAEKLSLALGQGGTPLELMRLWRDFLLELEPADTLAQIAGEDFSLDGEIRDAGAVVDELGKKIAVLEDLRLFIGPAANVQLRGVNAVEYLIGWARTAKLPIRLPQSGSVTIYAGSPPTLASHKYWIMTGVDYNSWPGTLRESPLLADSGKRLINESTLDEDGGSHIPELHEQREQKEALFRRLIATARGGVILTRSTSDANGRLLGDSQFAEDLFDHKKTGGPRGYKNMCRIEYPISRLLPLEDDVWFSGAETEPGVPRLERGCFPRAASGSAAVGSGQEKKYVSLSALDDWINCPYLYWCRRIARLEPPRRGLYDFLRAGTVTHKLWEICWRDYLEKGISLPQLVATHWQDIAAAGYPELFSDPRLRREERSLFKRSLALAQLQQDIEGRIHGRTGVELEYKLPDYEIEGIVFQGRADRIDLFGTGAVVLDYKSGGAAKYGGQLQPAAYAVLLREAAGLEPLGYGWFGLWDTTIKACFDDAQLNFAYCGRKGGGNDVTKKLDSALRAMRDMASALNRGIFPASYGSQSCRGCSYSELCRRKENPYYRPEEDEGLLGGEDDGE